MTAPLAPMMVRVARGVGANLFGAAVTLALQIGAVPWFVAAWGPARYAEWVILAAVPAALSFADCGLTTTTATTMTMAVARGDREEAARAFQATARFVGRIAAGLLVVGLSGLLLWPATQADGLRWALAAMAVAVLGGVGTNLLSAGFRATSRYAGGLLATDTIRLAETAAALGVASLGGGLAHAALALAAARLAGLLGMTFALHRHAPWLFVRLSGPPGRPTIDRRVLAVLCIPAAFAASLQGSTLVAGLLLPLGTVASFTLTRTLTRSVVQGVGLVTHALMPELSMAAGRGDRGGIASIVRLNRLAALITLFPAWALLVWFGPWLLALWTHGRVTVDSLPLAMLATAALCHGLWLSSANLLLALDRQAEYAFWFLSTAVGGTVVALPLTALFGLSGLAAASLLAELTMLLVMVPRLREFRSSAPRRLRFGEA